MQTVTVHEAKTHLSRLLRKVAGGEEVLVLRGKVPIAKIVPLDIDHAPRRLGLDKGRIWIAPDFDAPLPEEVLRAFEP
ncbi:type II toxin-antitoxin system Phd/YefM family antitoxin [Methylacidimicrobium sp. B4]|nr:type II toxin-antitoxin system Phd/YefM family antitoxin [Methylacidimicrobium sp. B4]QSR85867.1 type II toxin-antitoxin system Phd/YefM family antitoxin [Methylacidimicrobium sp. B4]